MDSRDTAAGFLAAMVHYATHRSHAHTLSMGLEGFCDDDLGYCPVPELKLDWGDEWRHPAIQTPRRIIGHMIIAATQYANGLLGERGDEWSRGATEARVSRVAQGAEGLVAALTTALARLQDCLPVNEAVLGPTTILLFGSVFLLLRKQLFHGHIS